MLCDRVYVTVDGWMDGQINMTAMKTHHIFSIFHINLGGSDMTNCMN